ncbi:MAG: T9SS type A sorting domain-containing protein [Bacteroidetes bacterium]|nr:T9SS type A sorting domain-containing protein [Bacteroidota bacterium]
MKKIYILLITILSIYSFTYAQITITTADMPATGNKINKSTALTTGTVDYTLTGTNYTWNFSALVPVSQSVDTFVTVLSTPIFYYPSYITSANQALKQPNISLGVAQMSNVFNFYNNASAAYGLIGYAAQINAIPIPLKYNTADRIYKFPLNYGNVDSTASSASMSVTSIGYFGETKRRKNIVDGWGTLTTPYGTFQVLRVKSIIYQKDTLSLDTIPFALPAVVRNITEYKWVGKSNGIPLLEIVETSYGIVPTITTTINYIDSVRVLTGITERPINISESVKVFPNPVTNQFTISYNLTKPTDVNIQLFDLTGKEVKTIEKGMIDKGNYQQTYTIQDERLIRGIYFIKFQFNNSTYTKKLVIL